MLRRLLILLPALLLVTSTMSQAAGKRTARRGPVDGTAAVVDSIQILRTEVNDQAALMAQQYQVDLNDPAAALKFKNEILDGMVGEKVIASEARRLGIVATQAEIDAEVERAVTGARRNLRSEEAFQEQLRRENMTEESLRRKYAGDVKNQLAVRKLVQREVQSKVTADSTDGRAYFDKHHAELPLRPEMFKLSVILIQVKPGEAVKARARDKATMVLSRLKGGDDFTKLATLFSDDPSAKDGGKLPWFSPGDFDSVFDKAARALKPGQTSEVVETRFGFHVIQVDSVQGLRIKARHILVMVQPDSADSAAALEKARAVRARAFAREDWAKLAEQFSDDPESRSHGGQLEPHDASFFSQELGEVITKLLPYQISNVTRSPGGWLFFRLDEKQPPRPYQYAEIANELQEQARQEKFKTEYDKWVAGLKKKHRVTVHYYQ
jgi:peptidyl-prolyl cis-trans isomerase SurA